ncbi:MAG: hypothetical protein A2842_01615 [Candidatus Wildermuthbacteria bacterium RIFCSPHIGHO2_01_FULL_48_25]|uniref:Uncharacterized protein n=1 Tax=Candidatus Wildermuthbacteria bacterium RIFCSPLOWO2_01_FULL_48_16 TaxID=1802461 RepID=A0A1G2RKX3_9BACT|nr:MAG: hypothetical protein A2842_01615 [Candidatus Wildermuthbacteria bacterium RIFCSPHIGHO2_01_FULL_48_25]OHA73486.1 MAG: hypothetical protein A3B24_03170 [Candidatus Wildermuthbacteria bacterium RIFCSPLOWO2_01_FULL_48_16]
MSYKGVIIEESLENKDVLKDVTILSTKVEEVTERHKTPWIKQWTLHTVEIPEGRGEEIAEKLNHSLDPQHAWYASFKDDKFHYVVFRGKVFKVDRSKPEQYKPVTEYGLSLGIPDYQLDFSPHIKEWKRD